MTGPRTKGGAIAKILLLTISIFLAVAVAEIAVRVLKVPPKRMDPLPLRSYRLASNPAIGYEYQPNYRATDEPYDASHRGFNFNSSGFRDRERWPAKPPGVFRVIVLGDSTTAGNGVPEFEKIYTAKLEAYLETHSAEDGLEYEVLNMGVGGYHTMQEIETLREKGLAYDPDLVLLLFCFNDFYINHDGGVFPNLVKTNRGEVYAAPPGILKWLLENSHLAFVTWHRLSPPETKDYDWYSENVLLGKNPAEAGFDLLAELQRQYGFTSYVAILPVFNGNLNEYKMGAVYDQVRICADPHEELSVIDLVQSFASINPDPTYFSYDGVHMKAQGHDALAQILVPLVRQVARQRLTGK